MKLQKGLIALAGLAVGATYGAAAMAQDSGTVTLSKSYNETANATITNNLNVSLSKDIDVRKDLTLSGIIGLTGSIDVSESAMATVDNKQIIDDNSVDGGTVVNNEATADGNVMNGATGRMALNVAAGDNNVQDNASALAAVGAAAAGASSDAEVFAYQESFNNDWTGGDNQINTSSLLGAVLQNASGDIAVNVASGSYNVQKNALTVASVTGAAVLAEAAAGVVQQTSFNSVEHSETQNISTLAGDVLGAASGNIGANVGTGTNNIQANSMSLATVQ